MHKLDTHRYDLQTNTIKNFKDSLMKKENINKIVKLISTDAKIDITIPFIDSVVKFIPKINILGLYNQYNGDTEKVNKSIKDLYIRQRKLNDDYDIDIKSKLLKINDKTGALKLDAKEIKYHKELNKELPDYNIKSNFSNFDSDNSDEYDESDNRLFKEAYTFSSVTPAKQPTKVVSSTNKTVANKSVAPPSSSGSTLLSSNPKQLIESTKILNYQSLIRESSIHIDSRYQNISNTNRSLIKFNIVGNTKVKQIGSGAITAIGNIEDVFEISIKPFNIPFSAPADNYYKKISLTIVELVSDCFEAYEDGQYHFMCSATQTGNLIKLTPDFDSYKFKKPVKLQDITLRFGSPLAPIIFDKDRLLVKNLDYTGNNPGEIEFYESHNLISGDLIYFTGFTTQNPVENINNINFINRLDGHLVNRVNDVKVTINFDFSTLINPIANGSQDIEIYL